MKPPNNVDKAVTPKTEPDAWADQPEPTEDTGKAGSLTLVSPLKADSHYAAAHDAAAELRAQRRAGRPAPEVPPHSSGPRGPVRSRIGTCTSCGHHVVADAWHAPCGYIVADGAPVACGTVGPIDELHNDQVDAYYQRQAEGIAGLGNLSKQPALPPEWRDVPGYPTYQLHSITRELRRNGGKPRSPLNSSYSLSVNGVRSSRGVDALWRLTFGNPKKHPGDWAGEIEPHNKPFQPGIPEWIAGGNASVIKRLK